MVQSLHRNTESNDSFISHSELNAGVHMTIFVCFCIWFSLWRSLTTGIASGVISGIVFKAQSVILLIEVA